MPIPRRAGPPASPPPSPSAPPSSPPPPNAPSTPEGPAPTVSIQVNALQALARQVFLFRLAMIAIGTPMALDNTARGAAAWLVASAVLVTIVGSYALYRDWERFGPLLLRHPVLLAVDTLFGALLLFTATPDSSVGYAVVCTPLLAGLLYGWRGAGVFAAVECLILAAAYGAAHDRTHATLANSLLLPGFCVLAGAVGVALRDLLLRVGAASQALNETRARLAVSEAVEEERARLAREMHDSVAKTLHGLALAADGLAGTAYRMDPLAVRDRAELVARSARRAAAESRELLSDLRRESGLDGGVDLLAELRCRTGDFTRVHGLTAELRPLGGAPLPPVPQAVARQLLAVVAEAMENVHRHAGADRVVVLAGVADDAEIAGGAGGTGGPGGVLRVGVRDDGTGLPEGLTLDGLRRTGHFGLVGMAERAASIGARIRIGKGGATGTEILVELPMAAITMPPQGGRPP
ncbi:histidine kinase [Streptomyces sp. AM 4-1-1]|uniref:sensor histidine kinase n=1 Tax=Streptomyces sp. AM 4-1-1 TaxID=3028710 RepID=UPI0023B8E2DE|nr:histidine kinase [Streptomyces sp. AM 4-1-1]WEH35609.1 histidine kinase [Streptomyces sp. AM 4-1-1]